MHRFHKGIEAISLWMARVGGLLLIATSVLLSIEIVARKFASMPFSIGTELTMYALAASASWSFSYALLRRAHVRIDIIRNLTGRRVRAALDLMALFALGVVAIVLCRFVWDTVETSWSLGARENTPLGTPLVIPQGIWFIGLCWFVVVCIEQIVLAVVAALRRDFGALAAIAAPAGVDDEIAETLGTVPQSTGARV